MIDINNRRYIGSKFKLLSNIEEQLKDIRLTGKIFADFFAGFGADGLLLVALCGLLQTRLAFLTIEFGFALFLFCHTCFFLFWLFVRVTDVIDFSILYHPPQKSKRETKKDGKNRKIFCPNHTPKT